MAPKDCSGSMSYVSTPFYTSPMISMVELERHATALDCWIVVEGQVYDVTKWLPTHPGGEEVILSMAGQDATDMFLAVHKKEVRKLLPKYYIGELEPQPVSEVAKDYRALLKTYEEEGLFTTDPSFYCRIAARILVLLSLVVAGVVWSRSIVVHMICAVMLGMMWNMCSFIGHDAGHNSITRSRKLDSIIGLIAGNLMTGIGIGWWKDSHNVHHIVCNSLDCDPDLQHLPLIAISSKYFDSLYSVPRRVVMTFDSLARTLVSYQHISFWPLMTVARINLYMLTLGTLLTKKSIPNKALEFAALGLFFTWYGGLIMALPSGVEQIGFLYLSLATCGILHWQISLSHFPMPTFVGRPENDSFCATQVKGTLDVDLPPWLDWFWGGLQFQVVHHLFPRMSRKYLRRAAGDVERLCKKHGLLYHKLNPWRATLLLHRALYTAAMEARSLKFAGEAGQPSLLWDAFSARG